MRTQKPLIRSSLNYESPHDSDTTFMNHNKLNSGPDAFHSGKDIQSHVFKLDNFGYLKSCSRRKSNENDDPQLSA